MASLLASRSSTRTAVGTRSARVVQPRVAAPSVRRGLLLVAAATVDKAEVTTKVVGIIAEQLGKPVAEVKPEALFSDLGADSLDTVEIMMKLEEVFKIDIKEEGAEKITTVQEAADLIIAEIESK